MTSTTSYKVFIFPETPEAGLGFRYETQEFSTLKEAQIAGRKANATSYEIHAISTIVEPSSKKNPQGSVSISTSMIERRTLREPQWAMEEPSPTGLRIQYGINGYFQLKLSDQDALRAAVALRGLGMGLCWRPGRQMITANMSVIDKAQKILVKEKLCRP